MCRTRHRSHLQCWQKGSDYVHESTGPGRGRKNHSEKPIRTPERTHTLGDERPKQLRGGHLDTAACRRQQLKQGENDSITAGAAQRGTGGGQVGGGTWRKPQKWDKGKRTRIHTYAGVTFVKSTICDYAQPGRTEASGGDCWFTEPQTAGGVFRRQCE